jgi:hypothetical protein
MGLVSLFYPWGLVLQAAAVIHFIRRRPDAYWLFVIVFLGPIGALIYIGIEVVPDLGLLSSAFDVFPRRKRIRWLEAAVLDNPSVGNYEELADLYLDDGRFADARACYDKAISPRIESLDAFYRRAIAEIHLDDFEAAVSDLERVTAEDPAYDRNRAAGLLAHAYARTGRHREADALFSKVVERSTLSETYYNFAVFLESSGRPREAGEWAGRILAKKPTMPAYLRRRERGWFRKAQALVKRVAV